MSAIKFEFYPNPDVTRVHVNTLVANDSVLFVSPGRLSSAEFIEHIGDRAARLANELYNVPGVDELSFKRYEVGIGKGKMFTWEEMRPGIIEAFRYALFDGAPVSVSIEHVYPKDTCLTEDELEDHFLEENYGFDLDE